MDEFIEQFLLESRENVEGATADLLALEAHPHDRARLDSAFRAFHTLKGGAGIVGFDAMSRAVHAAEDLLSNVRSGARPITPELVGDCLACLDQVVQWLDAMDASGELPDAPQADALVARLSGATRTTPASTSRGATNVEADAPPASDLARAILDVQLALIDDAHAFADGEGRVASAGAVAANVLRHDGRPDEAGRVERATAASLAQRSVEPLREAIERSARPGDAPADARADARADASVDVPAATAPAVQDDVAMRTLRVDASRIDALVDLTGELTVATNAFGHAVRLAQDRAGPLAAALKERQAALERLVGELQQSVLAMRVRPLQSVFARFSRLVREMSAEIGKPARLVVEGGETDADKAIVEMLFEPLLHVVRNAMDHGIEPAAVRAAARKPPTATIRLRGQRRDNDVVVEVEDDGAGLDLDRIRQVAVERDVATPGAIATLSDAEVAELIFAPGFTTASVVTGLSGRGVGMDSVRTAVQRVGGRVGVETRRGVGTTVRLTLPFSVMLTRVMVVGAGAGSFGIALDGVVETLRVPWERLVPVGASQVVVIRDQAIPVIDLAAALGLSAGETAQAGATLVVVRAGGSIGALCVDRIGEAIDVMLKPLEGLLADTRGIAGSTLQGDGSVLLILDLEEIFG